MERMTAEQAAEWGKTLDFPTVWAALMELRETMDKESAKLRETMDKESAELRETMAKGAAELRETMDKGAAETKALVDETTANVNRMSARVDAMMEKFDRVSSNVGGLNRSVGELMEVLIAARLWEKFDVYGYNLRRAYPRVIIYDDNNRMRTDIDVLLSNTQWCMVVEVKRWAKKKAVDELIQRMNLVHHYPPAETRGKRILGALAGGVVFDDAREYAFENGLYVVELTGESTAVLKPPAGFKAKEW
jgi:hypothetical protein